MDNPGDVPLGPPRGARSFPMVPAWLPGERPVSGCAAPPSPQQRKAAGPAAARFLASLAELRAHLAARLHERLWPDILGQLGIDAGTFAAGAPAGAALIMAEQAASLWMARDAMRHGLIRSLVAAAGFDPESSGVYELRCDRITTSGPEGSLHTFMLHPGLGRVRLLPSSVIQAVKGLAYSSLRCDERICSRLADIVALSLRVVAAGSDPPRLIRLLKELVFEPLPTGLRPLVSAGRSREAWEAIAADLRAHDLATLATLLRGLHERLVPDRLWGDLWAEANAAFLGAPVRSLDTIFSHFVRAIVDPLALARALAVLTDAPAGKSVTLVGFEEDGRLRIVTAHLPEGRFTATDASGEAAEISWDRVYAAAAAGRARPAGALEYLLLGAAGYYILVDPTESVASFQAGACMAYQRLTGHSFPWLRPAGDGAAADLDALAAAFHPGFARRRQAWIAAFLHG